MRVLPQLLRRFKVLIVDPVVAEFAVVRAVFAADFRAIVIRTATIIGLKMLTVAGNQQEPRCSIHEDRKRAVHHVPTHIVKLFPRLWCVNTHGKVAATTSRAVTAKDFANLQIFADRGFGCGHIQCLLNHEKRAGPEKAAYISD